MPLQYRIIPDLVSRRVRETPDRVAFCVPDGRDAWQPVTWSEYAARVARIAEALRRIGLVRGQRAAILAPTSMDWEYTQMACLTLGISVVGIDPNYSLEQRNDALRLVEIAALFVQDELSAAAIPAEARGKVERLVTFDGSSAEGQSGASSLDSLLRNVVPSADLDGLAAADPDDEALVVFSSGTTGRPKPIPYSHRQVLAAVRSILDAYPDIAEGTHLLCWLPLANLFQRVVDFCAIERGATSYVISDPREVMHYLPLANPHLLIGVPRFYEKLHAGITERIATVAAPVSAVIHWALETGVRRARAMHGPSRQSVFDHAAAKVADWLVLRRLRKSFGSNLHYLVSGSAPMPSWLLDWFDGIGLPVFEAYGVSENIVPVAMNRPGARRRTTVGRPVAGQEVRLADDNEILVRGPGVFHGYLPTPGVKILGPDSHGFWATGDYGEFDGEGFLRVTGRKSDVFKSAAGRWVAPADVEALLRRVRYVDHAMVVGAGRRFVVALVSIDSAKFARAPTRDDTAVGMVVLPAHEAGDLIRRDLLAATAALAPYQRPTGVLITTRRFTIEDGEVTANLKLRRSVLETEFAARIEGLLTALEAQADTSPRGAADDGAPLLVHWA